MFCEKLSVEGILPERALLRLKRAGICVKNAKKVKKTQILFRVSPKDSQKVFAIYPKVCYNGYEQSSYRIARVGEEPLLRVFRALRKRAGILIGAGICLPLSFLADGYVFAVDVVGAECYRREVLQTLNECGIDLFSVYDGSKADAVCAKLLALDGVGFCSVQKKGGRVTVRLVKQPFKNPTLQSGGLVSPQSGKVKSLTVLRGTPLKKAGDSVQAGETLVADYLLAGTDGNQKVAAAAIARACIACTYEAQIEATDAQSAFAEAYLSIGLSPQGEITAFETAATGQGFWVRIDYEETVTINF